VTEFALKILSMEFYKGSLKLLGLPRHLRSDFTIQKIDLMRFVMWRDKDASRSNPFAQICSNHKIEIMVMIELNYFLACGLET
jgi:hypothetical protein